MSSAVAINDERFADAPFKGKTPPGQNSDLNNIEDDMPPRRHDGTEDDDIRDIIAREVRYAIREQAGGAVATRSVDTLRRDIGIFSILLAMMIQTGAAFYWAGGVSRSQEAARETIKQVQDDQAYTRAQLQLIDGKLQKIEGREAERERNQKGR